MRKIGEKPWNNASYKKAVSKYLHVETVDHYWRISYHSNHTGTVWCDTDTRFSMDAHRQTGPVGNMLLGIMGSITGCVPLLFFNSW
jgi:hypothetical protein